MTAVAVLLAVLAQQAPAQQVFALRPIPPPGTPVPARDRDELARRTEALGRRVDELRGRAAAAGLWPDVEIYRRAVAVALGDDQMYGAADVARAGRLLAEGEARATALAGGRAPWVERPGPVALGYVSGLDGSVQPYGLYLPATFSPRAPRPFRLDVWFHGRGEDLTELRFIDGVARSGGPFTRPDALVLQPYGRFCNASKFAGEVDFREALADVRWRVRVDDDRVVIRGFSMGGATAWHLGAHFAAEWAAVAPGAGFAETRRYLRQQYHDEAAPPPWEEALYQLYDAVPYAANLRNTAVVAYSGEIDPQRLAADTMGRALAAEGVDMTHVNGPQTAHAYHPAARPEIDRRVDALAARGRDPAPRRVTLVTATLKYDRQAWVVVEALGRHWQPARVEAELAGADLVKVTTRNVEALALEMPPGRCPFARAPSVVIDGQRLAGPPPQSDRAWTARFHRAGARWQAAAIPEEGLRKRHDLQGPIDDAFMTPFLIVTPTGQPAHPGAASWVAAEQARAVREWRRQFRGEPRVKRDADVTDADVAAYNLILWGDPGSNAIYGRIADRLPLRWTRDTEVPVLVYPNPLAPAHYVVTNSGVTFREYDYLTNARQTPKLPDWAVVDVTTPPDARAPGRVLSAGFFDERWRLVGSVSAAAPRAASGRATASPRRP